MALSLLLMEKHAPREPVCARKMARHPCLVSFCISFTAVFFGFFFGTKRVATGVFAGKKMLKLYEDHSFDRRYEVQYSSVIERRTEGIGTFRSQEKNSSGYLHRQIVSKL